MAVKRRRAAALSSCASGAGKSRRSVQPLRGPDQRHIDHAGEQEMRRQPILRDFDAVGEAGGDHPPADATLQRTEPENEPQRRPQRRFHPAAP